MIDNNMSTLKYDPRAIARRWQHVWAAEKTWHVTNEPDDRESVYVLEMLPYPSGDPHMGHMKCYAIGDGVAHYHRRNGRRVLHPMGYDAFGLPAENNAIKTGKHPRTSTEEAIANFRRAFDEWGISIDWSREFGTHEPEYYKWTQWCFLQLFKHDLAYRKSAAVNWCPSDQTVLANEQAPDGKCERCGDEVEVRQLEQWFLRITDYSDQLIDDLDTIDWPEHVKSQQKHWIGRSAGAEVSFRCESVGIDFPVFTTRPDTLFGATFFVISPEHPDVMTLAAGTGNEEAVRTYLRHAAAASNRDRSNAKRPKQAFRWAGRSSILSTVKRCRCTSPTTSSWNTAPEQSWPSPATTSGTTRSPRLTACPSSASSLTPRATPLPLPRHRSPATASW